MVAVVEDADSIREGIVHFLSPHMKSRGFSNAEEFIEWHQDSPDARPDFVLTDIKMPGMSGLDLVEWLQKHRPGLPCALMTAYDVNQYVNFCKNHLVAQLIPKTVELDLSEILVLITKTLTGDIFGPDKYYPDLKSFPPGAREPATPPADGEIIYTEITSSEQRLRVLEAYNNYFSSLGEDHKILGLVLDEMSSNPLVRAARDSKGRFKYQTVDQEKDILIPLDQVVLDPEDYFEIGVGRDGDDFILSTRDPHGLLTREEILYRLDRHTTTDPAGLPLGLTDTHGRGLFLIREQMGRTVFNIRRGKRTEVICSLGPQQASRFKGIYIFENE